MLQALEIELEVFYLERVFLVVNVNEFSECFDSNDILVELDGGDELDEFFLCDGFVAEFLGKIVVEDLFDWNIIGMFNYLNLVQKNRVYQLQHTELLYKDALVDR